MRRNRVIPLALAAAIVPAAPALADPGPGQVEVLNEAGVRVGDLVTGADAIEAAVARVRTGALSRANDALAWTIVAGAGTYGDAVLNEPALTLRPSAGAAVTISGTAAGVANTGGECLDITRGAVTVVGVRCVAPADRGIEVQLAPAEGGVVLDGVSVDRARTDGIAVTGGSGITIRNATVSASGVDGIRLARVTGPGPYRIEGGAVTRSGDDGIDLVDDAQRVQVAGVTVDSSRANGLESDDSGSSDLVVDGSILRRSGDHGAVLGGGGTRLALQNTTVSGNGDYGVVVGRATGTALRGLRFEAGNRLGDLRFTAEARTGGAYENLAFGTAVLGLPGDPVGVVLTSVAVGPRAGLTGLPPGLLSVNRFVRVRDVGGGPSSAVRLRFVVPLGDLAPLRVTAVRVYEDDPPGNRRQWQEVPGTAVDPVAGTVEVGLTDGQIASGSDTRSAVYGPLGPRNGAPEILGVLPVDNALVRGRDVFVRARVRDEEALSTGSFILEVDGVRRGGVSYTGDLVQFAVSRLSPGIHRVRLVVVDPNQLRSERTWTFAVTNGRPRAVVRRAVPRPNSLVLFKRRTIVAVPVKDDLPLRTLRTSMRIDGRKVPAVIRGGRLLARVPLGRGKHRVVVSLRDRDGATTVRRWSFRIVRP